MIKLIATDMDGTLLDGNSQLPSDFFSTLDKLYNKNIKFIVASGRPYYTLYENFKPYSDKLYYICDNGAYIVNEKKEVTTSIIDKNLLNHIIRECLELDNVELILCGTKGAYCRETTAKFSKEIDKYYIKKIIVSDFFNINDDIFKVTLCDFSNSKNNSFKVLNPIFGSDFKVVVSGEIWLDIMNNNINKGMALEEIQKAENITSEETMVFGDFYNDIEMLQKGYYSFVMENANDDMKKYGNFIAKSNIENGVIKAINEYIFK